MASGAEWEQRARANLSVLSWAMRIQEEINKDPNPDIKKRGQLEIKLAVPHQDVIGANDELLVVKIESHTGVLYAKLNVKGANNGDMVSILLGDIGPIQFLSRELSKRLEKLLFAVPIEIDTR